MDAKSRALVVIVAVLLLAVGFVAGAGGAAWQNRERRAERWRDMIVEHEGKGDQPSRTRIVFESTEAAIQAVEVRRDGDGKPLVGRAVLKDATELTVDFDEGRPRSVVGPDGHEARLRYDDGRIKVSLRSKKGDEDEEHTVAGPVELSAALGLASIAIAPGDERLTRAPKNGSGVLGSLVGVAHAADDEAEEPEVLITVAREILVELELEEKGKSDPGDVELTATCAPYTCLVTTPKVEMPGESTVRISVSSSIEQGKLDKPDKGDLGDFEEAARDERRVAAKGMDDVAAVVAAVGATSIACKELDRSWDICAKGLGRNAVYAGGAVNALLEHEVEIDGRQTEARTKALYYEERARKKLDEKVTIELCANRDGYARECTKISGKPFDEDPMSSVDRELAMRKGIGGTLTGSFVIQQSDGSDCKFSPSPRTGGTLKLSFDNEKRTVTGTMSADERGSRPNLRCSLGTANMSWTQKYSITVTQTFTEAELSAGGKLPLKLTGSMNGNGGYSFSNCRSSGGGSVNCPAGKNESYSYPVELIGDIDMNTQKGGGRIIIRNAPLSTNGTWKVPGEGSK